MPANQKSPDWSSLLRRPGCSLLYYSFILAAYSEERQQETLLTPFGIINHRYLDGYVLLDERELNAFRRWFADRLTSNYVGYFIERCQLESRRLLTTAAQVREKARDSQIGVDVLASLFGGYASDAMRLMTFLTPIVMLQQVLEQKIKQSLIASIDANGQEAVAPLFFPREKTLTSDASAELLRLALKVTDVPELARLADASAAAVEEALKLPEHAALLELFSEYLERYDFLSMEYYVGRPMTLSELVEAAVASRGRAARALQHAAQDAKTAEAEYKTALKRWRVSGDVRRELEQLQAIHRIRQLRSDALMKAGRDVYGLLTRIGDGLGIDYDELTAMMWDEISESLVAGALTVDHHDLVERQRGFGVLLSERQRSVVVGGPLAAYLEEAGHRVDKVTELRGTSVSPGRCEGRVSVVMKYQDLAKVQAGDVFVSAMTDPYYIVGLAKAGAIVTDEGGYLSHAAIISREFGIPGVVNTREATLQFADGERVRVEAPKRGEGSIRRLSEQKS